MVFLLASGKMSFHLVPLFGASGSGFRVHGLGVRADGLRAWRRQGLSHLVEDLCFAAYVRLYSLSRSAEGLEIVRGRV